MSKKELVDWVVEGVVDWIESTVSSIAFNSYRAALSGLCEVISSGKRIRLALSTRSLKASFSASDEKVIPSDCLHPDPAVAIFSDNMYLHVPGNYIIGTKDTF